MAYTKNSNNVALNDFGFSDVFNGCSVGTRELKMIVGMMGLNCDVYRTSDLNIKKMIALKLNGARDEIFLKKIQELVLATKVNLVDFEFVGDSRSEFYLVSKILRDFFDPQDLARESNSVIGILSPRDIITYLFDINKNPVVTNIGILYSVKKKYIENKKKMKFANWYSEDEERVICAEKYLARVVNSGISISNVDDLLCFFYENMDNVEFCKFHHKKIQEIYNNQKSRERRSTKQCNFLISQKSSKNIEKIAEKYRVNKSIVVDLVFSDLSFLNEVYYSILSGKLSLSVNDDKFQSSWKSS